jgi:hypothetical protein
MEYKGGRLRVDNPFKHGVSSFLLLLDFALSRTPVVSYHISVRRLPRGRPHSDRFVTRFQFAARRCRKTTTNPS